VTRTRKILTDVIAPQRVRAAERERAHFLAFCAFEDIPPVPEAVCLYLLGFDDDKGVQTRARLARLDLAATLEGSTPPSSDRVVRRYLAGTYSLRPLGPVGTEVEPLYVGDVRTLVDTTMAPTWQQLRDHSYLLVMNASGLRWAEMNRLAWHDVHFSGRLVEIHVALLKGRYGARQEVITLSPHRSRLLCAVAALRRLHAASPFAPDRPVFSTRGGNLKSRRLRAIAANVDHRRSGPQQIGQPVVRVPELRRLSEDILRPLPIALRDRLLILLGFSAALSNQDAQRLTVGDIVVERRGLLVTLPNRRHSPIGVPARPGSPYCVVEAWNAWWRVLKKHGDASPTAPIFVGCDPYQAILGSTALRIDSLTAVVAGRAAQSRLAGAYGFMSLQDGLIRTALRLGVAQHDVAAHVGHSTLEGIRSRDQQESAMMRNILPLLGI
jgi:integrase